MAKVILCLPTWLIVILYWPYFPDDHPWKRRQCQRFTPRQWAAGATELTMDCSAFLWWGFIWVGLCTGLLIWRME